MPPIIDLKLTKAAMLEDDGKGRIFILDSKSDEARSLMDENGGERKVFTMLTGGRNG
ncbi:MAG: hypothetical protein HZB23_10775 [Deltaproteobacteria bacterium]|nr:hypothetical protein [Deltaproteobacteria bacterium]